MLGYAYQKGALPIGHEAIEQAIELNGAAVAMNLAAFRWGRRAAADLVGLQQRLAPATVVPFARPRTLEDVVASRSRHLAAYQDERLAERYRGLVGRVQAREQALGLSGLAEAVAVSYARVLAYKDEYEVARLYADPAFAAALRRQFEGDYSLRFHLAPPLLAERDPQTGHLRKRAFGPWILPAMRLLAKLKGLRGTAFDPFGRTAERRQERALIGEYESLVAELLAGLTPANHALAVELAAVAGEIKGYGHVKEASLARARSRQSALLARWRAPEPALRAAE
jgi:indolepyruvate ferredoxin oxidoreductase